MIAKDEERLRRFEQEAKSLASLNHPNVAQIFGVDQVDDTWFLVLELVPGETLEDRIARGFLISCADGPSRPRVLFWQPRHAGRMRRTP